MEKNADYRKISRYCSFDPTYKPSIISEHLDFFIVHKISFNTSLTFTEIKQYSKTEFQTGIKILQNWEFRFFMMSLNYISLGIHLLSSSLPSKPVSLIFWFNSANRVIEQNFLQGESHVLEVCYSIKNGTTVLVNLNARLYEPVGKVSDFPKQADNFFTNDYNVCLWGNGWKYKAHREILSKASPVFGAMFQHDMTESSDGKVNIKDTDGPSILALLTYIYTGTISPDTNVCELYKLADKYQIEDLKSTCLNQPITITSVIPFLNLSQDYDLSDLKNNCILFIKSNMNEVAKTESWAELQHQHALLLLESFNKLAL